MFLAKAGAHQVSYSGPGAKVGVLHHIHNMVCGGCEFQALTKSIRHEPVQILRNFRKRTENVSDWSKRYISCDEI